MENYPKEVKLKNGEVIQIKEFADQDMDNLIIFFAGLPIEDRMYLRMDVKNRDNIVKRFSAVDPDKFYVIIATLNNRIIAQGNISRAEFGWKRKLGELRIVVAKDWQRQGLCTVITRELFLYALSQDFHKVQAEIMSTQETAIASFEKMGFNKEAVLKKHVTDIKEKRADLIIMSLDIQEMWNVLEDHLHDRQYVI